MVDSWVPSEGTVAGSVHINWIIIIQFISNEIKQLLFSPYQVGLIIIQFILKMISTIIHVIAKEIDCSLVHIKLD